MIKKIFTIEGVKAFFRVRDDEGNFSWAEFGASFAQLALICATLLFLYLIGVI